MKEFVLMDRDGNLFTGARVAFMDAHNSLMCYPHDGGVCYHPEHLGGADFYLAASGTGTMFYVLGEL